MGVLPPNIAIVILNFNFISFEKQFLNVFWG